MSTGRRMSTRRVRACLEEPAGRVHQVRLEQRPADLVSLGAEERERHPAADQKPVDLAEERLDQRELLGDLRPAEDRDERVRGRIEDPREGGELLLHQEPRHRRPEMPRDAFRRRVGAVGGGEGVVHVDVAEPRERLGERGVVGLLALVEPEVLEEQELRPSAARRPGARRPRPTQSGARGTGLPEERREAARDRGQRELRLGAAFRPAEMRGEHHRPHPARPRVAEGRERRADPRVLAHLAVAPERDVEVDPHEHPAVAEVEILDRALGHGGRTGAAGRARPLRGPEPTGSAP